MARSSYGAGMLAAVTRRWRRRVQSLIRGSWWILSMMRTTIRRGEFLPSILLWFLSHYSFSRVLRWSRNL